MPQVQVSPRASIPLGVRRHLIFILGVLLLLVTMVARADAARPDSAAPPGASSEWLPREEWVMERWLPFDEGELKRTLGMNRVQVYAYLVAGDSTLLDLARSRGRQTADLAEHLVASRTNVSRAERRELLARTKRVLSQGHLAEHMLGHTMHHWAIWNAIPEVFGITKRKYDEVFLDALTPMELGALGGLSRDDVRTRVLTALDRATRYGVAERHMSAREGKAMRQMHRAYIDKWLTVRPPRTPRVTAASAPLPAKVPPLLCNLQLRQ